MDAQGVRKRAQEHGDALVEGDLRRAGADIDPAATSQAQEVLGALPQPLTGAEVQDVAARGDGWLVVIRYSGADRFTAVESLWSERDKGIRITTLRVL